MRRFAPLWFLLLILSVTACPVQAQKSIGPSDETLMVPAAEGADRGVVYCNHDGSFENGYSISHLLPPYYGCFAESFDLGYGLLEAAHFWFTQIGYYNGEPMDVYVWEGGVSGEPGEVLYMLPEVGGIEIPMWPECGETVVQIGGVVDGEFSVGYWPYLPPGQENFFICADENGPGGHPWVCVDPDWWPPPGWQHVSVIFTNCRALGICACFNSDPASVEEIPGELRGVESPTWGRIKAVFAK